MLDVKKKKKMTNKKFSSFLWLDLQTRNGVLNIISAIVFSLNYIDKTSFHQTIKNCHHKKNSHQHSMNFSGLSADIACSHMRSILLFTESVRSSCRFRACCDTCPIQCTTMGLNVDRDVRGSYRLTTNCASPFCRGWNNNSYKVQLFMKRFDRCYSLFICMHTFTCMSFEILPTISQLNGIRYHYLLMFDTYWFFGH